MQEQSVTTIAASNADHRSADDIHNTCRRWDAFWSGDHDGPMLWLRVPQQNAAPPPGYRLNWDDPQAATRQALRHIHSHHWLGDALPGIQPNLGPDQFAAWMGAELTFTNVDHTNWVHPHIEHWSELTAFDGHSEAWRRSLVLLRALRAADKGEYLIGMPDLHGNLDALSALRGPERLAMDLLDEPDTIKRALAMVGDAYQQIIPAFAEHSGSERGGYCSWLGAWCRHAFAITQCDYACMLSPRQFDDFVLPELKREWSALEHTIYHFDGVTALQHMPCILQQPEIDVVQWVPGAGNAPVWEWLDLLREIQAAGKAVHIHCPPERALQLLTELEPSRLIIESHCDSLTEGERFMETVATTLDHRQ